MRAPAERAEEARARMFDLFPEGFEEVAEADEGGVELRAYTDVDGEERARGAFSVVRSEVVAPGWEDAWKRFHRPVRVGPLWIGPPWESPDEGAVAVVVDPGRAFGTGAHATTRLCLELLVELERGSLVDLGCGSGVLAIAAAKLGFAPVTALDVDDAAVEATCRNARASRVGVDVSRANVLTSELPRADVAVANIERETVERLAARIETRRLVASGYLAGVRPALAGWRHDRRREREGWAADLYERETDTPP